jgi:hypothetical protein
MCIASNLHDPPVPCDISRGYRPVSLSVIIQTELDGDLQPVGAVRALPSPDNIVDWKKAAARRLDFIGIEDPRVFYWPNANTTDVFLIVNAVFSSHAHARQMLIWQVFPSIRSPVALSAVDNSVWELHDQKNWCALMPISTEYLFSRTVDPHDIVACTRTGACRPYASSRSSRFFSAFVQLQRHRGNAALHLGTNAIKLVSGDLLALLHIMIETPHNGRKYDNYPYIISGVYPHRILAVSRTPFTIPSEMMSNRSFLFTVSLMKDEDRVIVQMHIDDKVVVISVKRLKDLLRDMQLVPV